MTNNRAGKVGYLASTNTRLPEKAIPSLIMFLTPRARQKNSYDQERFVENIV
jgi:hypothetical protein